MKSLGIVRKIDEAGRIVLPKEMRKMFDLSAPDDAVEIFVENDMIILKKYAPSCLFCGETENTVELAGRKVCPKCIRLLNDIQSLSHL